MILISRCEGIEKAAAVTKQREPAFRCEAGSTRRVHIRSPSDGFRRGVIRYNEKGVYRGYYFPKT